MDFALPYTPEQEEFRKEVRAWLEENVPEEMQEPVRPEELHRGAVLVLAGEAQGDGRKGLA